MSPHSTIIAGCRLNTNSTHVEGHFVTEGGERYFKIENYDAMSPFLMSIVSDSDHWMYISSSGGVTAGRKNPDCAIFPYYTDDKIHESAETSGSKSIVRVVTERYTVVWEPFSTHYKGLYNCTKNLYKSLTGNSLIFEDINHDLSITFRIKWMNSEKYGWVRETTLLNNSDDSVRIELLDGIQNILPSGILKEVQERFSTLMDAYKKCELEERSGLGIFSLSSIPVDRAEPSEALKATTVWTTAGNVKHVLLSTTQLEQFRRTGIVTSEYSKRGIRGAYLIVKEIDLPPNKPDSHLIIAEVNQDTAKVINLIAEIGAGRDQTSAIIKDIGIGTYNLMQMVSAADGIQKCGDERTQVRHFSNVLFNIMRGGIYAEGYNVKRSDLLQHLKKFNRQLAEKQSEWVGRLEENIPYYELVEKSVAENDPDLYRLINEFLPLTFSRRHGDPSRPWNRFSIDVKNQDGGRSLSYEGNWRDIFQNWEALSCSYPGFLEGIISKFLNATTADGYNPYRITDKGVDWETFDPSDPWSFIGYWGDHQIIYLLKLLELQERYYPGKISGSLDKQNYVFANVPYRIKPYEEIVQDPNSTIIFDAQLHQELIEKADNIGADGKLLRNGSGEIQYTNLAEKLLITLLTKIGNFIPEAGIWLNTQRPEWNDANNALVGNGVSMVTLYYLRRFVPFLEKLVIHSGKASFTLSEEVSCLQKDINSALHDFAYNLRDSFSDTDRKKVTDRLGAAGSEYRKRIYGGYRGKKSEVTIDVIIGFTGLVKKYLDHTIIRNKREEGLYHAYNLIVLDKEAISIKHLPLMLEGQVAYLSSGIASEDEVIELLTELRNSPLYREDQNSYILYPDRELPLFTEKNSIPAEYVAKYPVLKKLQNGGGFGLIRADHSGGLHFNAEIRNGAVLKEKIEKTELLGGERLSEKEAGDLLEAYETLFNHSEFTGRSGSFFKYEGLGSIYWHMISKLLLAVGENIQRLKNRGADGGKIETIKQFYNEIREGIGVHKNPADYGAIPTDPYSHTPSMAGAQQPGMTGQVKEDILSRWFELGIEIREGKIFVSAENIDKNEVSETGELSFTFCGTHFSYVPGEEREIILSMAGGREKRYNGGMIDSEESREIFGRTGVVERVTVCYK